MLDRRGVREDLGSKGRLLIYPTFSKDDTQLLDISITPTHQLFHFYMHVCERRVE